jgi:hypothetical protein
MTSNNQLAELAIQKLRPGTVLYKHCNFTTPKKPKYIVVVAVQPSLLVLLINSKIHQYFYDKKLDKYHITIPKNEHSFLSHDSYANCIEAHSSFDISEIKQSIIENYQDTVKGWLSNDCLEKVYHAVKENTVIKRRHQKVIISEIEKQLPHLAQL